jgi:hypothetical protein
MRTHVIACQYSLVTGLDRSGYGLLTAQRFGDVGKVPQSEGLAPLGVGPVARWLEPPS